MILKEIKVTIILRKVIQVTVKMMALVKIIDKVKIIKMKVQYSLTKQEDKLQRMELIKELIKLQINKSQ